MNPDETLVKFARDWKPLLYDAVTLDTLKGDGYRHFIETSVLAPGCRLLLARHRRTPEWPYVETKFNPNTGCDLPPEAYQVVYAWFLGRGSESLDDHRRYLPQMGVLSPSEKSDVRDLFGLWIGNMTRAMADLVRAYYGRLPFRVTRAGVAVDADGLPVAVDSSKAGAGDIFGLKGLLSSADPALHELSRTMLQRAVLLTRQDHVENEQKGVPPGRGQGMRMLMQGAGLCAARKACEPGMRKAALAAAADCLGDVLEVHFDPATALFSEYADPVTGIREAYLDPGHANELVGLGLGMIEALEASEWAGAYQDLIARAKQDLPRILFTSTERGFNSRHPGLFKAVDNRTGRILNADMPWWNLPETMRAAVRAFAVVTTEADRQTCLDIYTRCHNAYFAHYLNRNNALFPVQTLDGRTGKVADVVPAVPEGDPLYHSNAAFLDLLDVVSKLK